MSKASADNLRPTAAVRSVADGDSADQSAQREFDKLISELANGSEEAAWRIADVYTPHILRAVRATLPSSLRRKIDSIDFAQIVWASMLHRRSYLSDVKSPQHLIAILSTVAKRKVADAFRYNTYQIRDIRREAPLDFDARPVSGRQRGSSEEGISDRNPTPSQLVGMQEKWAGLVDQLSPRDRKILRFRIQGDTYPVIAEKTSVSEATVRRVVDRIVEQLRA